MHACMHAVCTYVVGVLACLDGYMNIALEQTEEYVNGQLKNKYGDAFIRGNNGIGSYNMLINALVGGYLFSSVVHQYKKKIEQSTGSQIFYQS